MPAKEGGRLRLLKGHEEVRGGYPRTGRRGSKAGGALGRAEAKNINGGGGGWERRQQWSGCAE